MYFGMVWYGVGIGWYMLWDGLVGWYILWDGLEALVQCT